ncbi:hemin ABC transporter substrate-binding protein [Crenobacter cavernae]|uniref:Hemin ABC transporter substrate-binding protein n=2 Tax=Crenobacter cavernae TaxID=2290923 RepID=A0ABY0F9E2_9NEIS|nr:hemin ABC transporter substrate-binding protein [Crenobacter cavernae]
MKASRKTRSGRRSPSRCRTRGVWPMSPKAALAFAALALVPVPAQATERLVALTPDAAEILVALGAAGEVVGRERTALDPAIKNAPVIGFSRSLAVEPVLALKPTLVIGSAAAQPAGIYGQLKRVGLNALKINQREDGADFADGIIKLGRAIGREDAARAAARRFEAGMKPASLTGRRILLSYDGKMVAGRGTPGDTLIRAAGGINAAASVDGFKTLNREAWIAARPELIVLAEHNRAVYGGLAAFSARPEVAATPAGRSGKVVEWPAGRFLRVSLDSPADAKALAGLAR